MNAAKVKKCVWVWPELVAHEFLELTESDHLRHPKLIGLRDDKDARSVVREYSGES
jgi:bifunctional non-homologous end joining protein LigD